LSFSGLSPPRRWEEFSRFQKMETWNGTFGGEFAEGDKSRNRQRGEEGSIKELLFRFF